MVGLEATLDGVGDDGLARVGLEEREAAFAHLGLSRAERETAQRLCSELEAELGIVSGVVP